MVKAGSAAGAVCIYTRRSGEGPGIKRPLAVLDLTTCYLYAINLSLPRNTLTSYISAIVVSQLLTENIAMEDSVNHVATPAPILGLSWSKAGSKPRDLYSHMSNLYWSAVHREIIELIYTLQVWDTEEYTDVLNEYSCNMSLLQSPVTGLGSFLSRATGKSGVKMYDLNRQANSLFPRQN